MTRALNHSRANSADRMRQRGTDCISDYGLPSGLTPPKPRSSKADMRRQIEEATAKISRIVRCRCGHSGTVALPTSRLGAKLRCSKCGSLANIEKEKPAGAASGGLR